MTRAVAGIDPSLGGFAVASEWAFTVPGQPLPYQRAVFHGKRTLTPKRTREYRRSLVLCAAATKPSEWPLDARYAVTIDAVFSDKRHRDLDNVAKQVCDAANHVVWNDDSQVDELHVRRHLDRERPRLVVTVQARTE